MSDKNVKKSDALKRGSEAEVGYGQAPKHSQFKKGQSGNPKGRPKGIKNFKTELAAVLRSKVTVVKNGKPKSVRTSEAALMRLKEKALKGDPRALDRLLAYAQEQSDTSDARSQERHLSKLENDILGRYGAADEYGDKKGSGDE